MNNAPTSAFQNIYPDVDPTKGLPLSHPERGAIALASGILVYGIISTDYLTAGTGLVLCLISTLIPAQKTARRIRNEARDRFPDEAWCETASTQRMRILFPACWLLIMLPCLILAAMPSTRENTIVAVSAALITALLIYFIPAIAALWTPKKQLERQITNNSFPTETRENILPNPSSLNQQQGCATASSQPSFPQYQGTTNFPTNQAPVHSQGYANASEQTQYFPASPQYSAMPQNQPTGFFPYAGAAAPQWGGTTNQNAAHPPYSPAAHAMPQAATNNSRYGTASTNPTAGEYQRTGGNPNSAPSAPHALS